MTTTCAGMNLSMLASRTYALPLTSCGSLTFLCTTGNMFEAALRTLITTLKHDGNVLACFYISFLTMSIGPTHVARGVNT